MTRPSLAVPVGIVDKVWVDRTEITQKKKLVSIGTFDLDYLNHMVDLLSNETCGEIELLMSADNVMPDKSLSGLLVAKYDGENYIALAGISHNPPDNLKEENKPGCFGAIGLPGKRNDPGCPCAWQERCRQSQEDE